MPRCVGPLCHTHDLPDAVTRASGAGSMPLREPAEPARPFSHRRRDAMGGPRNLADLVAHAAARRPDHTALIADDVVLTWSELNGRIDAAAAGLLSLGVGTGDR
ncbi:MAG TPA: AMP-binding protein, partial [Mycobacteriales bacterium]|nr:AMP-binding protein [Mycobacteriales bacterium]